MKGKKMKRSKSKDGDGSSKIRGVKSKQVKYGKGSKKTKSEETGTKSRKAAKPWVPPVDPQKMKKYLRGASAKFVDVKEKILRRKLAVKEKKISDGVELAARGELLLTEGEGFLEADEGEVTTQFRQSDIQESVDAISASKRFDLDLREFGPYRMNYIRNGRFLLLGGRKGHVAAVDWITKRLLCEMNVMEGVYDVSWLHQETLFAVAQKKWVYIYDNQGIEIHCLKTLNEVIKLEYLPYHFLLAAVSSRGFLSWLDVSIGKMVADFHVSARGTAAAIAQNPSNAHLCIGEPNGVVSFWSPNSNKAVVTKWCHKQPIAAIAFDPKGTIFATSSMDRTLKLWDARNLQGPTEEMILRSPPRSLAYSHRGVLALGLGNIVQLQREAKTYLRHEVANSIGNLQFCPFEDVLGIAHGSGFSSILVPGSGEPNVDALEINPFRSKSQRKEAEVKALLEKIPSELITWDPRQLQTVHVPSLQAIIEAKQKLLHVKAPEIQYTPKKKTGKASKTTLKRKTIVKDGMRKRYFEEVRAMQEQELEEVSLDTKSDKPATVLDRFIPKQKKPVK